MHVAFIQIVSFSLIKKKKLNSQLGHKEKRRKEPSRIFISQPYHTSNACALFSYLQKITDSPYENVISSF